MKILYIVSATLLFLPNVAFGLTSDDGEPGRGTTMQSAPPYQDPPAAAPTAPTPPPYGKTPQQAPGYVEPTPAAPTASAYGKAPQQAPAYKEPATAGPLARQAPPYMERDPAAAPQNLVGATSTLLEGVIMGGSQKQNVATLLNRAAEDARQAESFLGGILGAWATKAQKDADKKAAKKGRTPEEKAAKKAAKAGKKADKAQEKADKAAKKAQDAAAAAGQ